MELRPLRYFAAVAEERNIRQAAARLHLSGQKQPPPEINRQWSTHAMQGRRHVAHSILQFIMSTLQVATFVIAAPVDKTTRPWPEDAWHKRCFKLR